MTDALASIKSIRNGETLEDVSIWLKPEFHFSKIALECLASRLQGSFKCVGLASNLVEVS